MGSVGISLAPILVTTLFTSGNFFNSVIALVVALIVSCRVLPVINLASIAKSPSSSSGINSPPKREATIIDRTNKDKETITTFAGCNKNLESRFLNLTCKAPIIRSEKFSFSGIFLLRPRLVTMGT